MTLLELLDDCARRGVTLWADGDKLQVRSPIGAVTSELQEQLRLHKAELLGRLRRSENDRRVQSTAPLERASRTDGPQPLSLVQQSLWFLNRMDPESLPAYNLRKALMLEGTLDVERWEAALRAVVARHEILRSCFEVVDEHPVTRVVPSLPVSLEVVDLSTLDPTGQEAEVQRRLDEEGRRVFDLTRAPLYRTSLLRLGPERWFFLLNANHLVADAWSSGLILQELAATYRNVLDGERAIPSAPAYVYADYVHWQRARAERRELDPHLAYWKEQLADLPVLELPTDGSTRRRAGYAGGSESYDLPLELAQALRAFSREHGVTLFTTFLASFAAFLSRVTGQSDFPIGASVAGRTRRELEDVIGFFANLLVLRMDLSSEPTFVELLGRVQQTTLEGFEHQDVPFDLVVKSLAPERTFGHNPLFQVLFLFLQSDLDGVSFPGLESREVQVPSVTSKFDLSLHVEDTGTGLRGLIEYKTDLFERSTIRRFLAGWMQLLKAAIEDPMRSVAELPILTAEERQELVAGRNRVHEPAVPHATIHDWFAAQVERTPDRIALTDGKQQLTYRELDQQANQLARALRARGVGPDVRVGLCLERSIELVVSVLAVLKAGGAYVPLDPADPPSRLAYIRADSQFPILVTTSVLLPRLDLTNVDVMCIDQDLDLTEGEARLADVSPLNAAYVIYTSGSTGQPRGVVVTHANVTRLMTAADPWFGFSETDVWALFHSYAFDFSVWELWGSLLYGGRLVVVPHLTSRTPEAFHRLLVEERVTVLNQTPSAFRSLVNLDLPPDAKPLSLRFVIFGGEALDPAMLKPWFDRHGDERPKFINMYGITETTVHVTWRRITREDVDRGGSTIGARIPDLTLYILDGKLEPVPVGVAGELHVGGAGLTRGYLGRPALTATRFVPDPFSDVAGARLYRTGDRARWQSGGDIEYLGRCDEQLKIRGFRIEPGEIESVLRHHEGLKECVVMAREDSPGQKRLVCYYIPAGADSVDPAALRKLCQERLPTHMVPAAYVPVSAWPRTRNDKLDRTRLPVPESSTSTAKGSYVAPRTDTERALAAIWSRVLGVGDVGVHDDFFALGGDSILSLEVLSQMRKQGLRSSVTQLYQYQRIADLAEALETAPALGSAETFTAPFALISAADHAKLPNELVDAYPLSQLQAGMLYEEQLRPDRAVYRDICSFQLRMPLDEAAWTKVLQGEVDRNETLRTAFDLIRFSEPLQLVYASATAVCTFDDLSTLTDEEQQRRIAALVDEERRLPFEYRKPPLLRFYLLRRSDDRTQIVFGFHHAILDGWSVSLMFSRLLTDYLADLKLRPGSPAEELPAVRFADFISLERAALTSDEENRFWREETGRLPVVQLQRRVDVSGTRRPILLPVPLPDDVSQGLERLSRDARVPLKTVLLAAHLRVLGALTGQSHVVTGLVTNGRPEQPGGDRVLGLFLNTLPMQLELGSGSFVDLVQRTFEAERRLLAHRRFPMAAVKRFAAGRTLFDSAFNFVHFHVYQEVMRSSGVELLDHQVWEETDFPFLVQFSVFPGSSHVELVLIYDESEFAGDQMKAIAGYYACCLQSMTQAPEIGFRSRSLLSAEERELLALWGGGVVDVPRREGLHRWFEEQVQSAGDRVAVRFEGQALTYQELDERANRLAHYLQSIGVGPETLVGLCLDRSLELVVGILGILKAGGAYVPLDPAYPVNRLRFVIEDSQVAVVVTHSSQDHVLKSALAGTASPARLVMVDREAAAIEAQPAQPPETAVSPDQAAYVIYTSGSTGRPKGVVVTHGNVTRLMSATESLYDFRDTDVWTLFHSYAFDFSVWEMWGALLYGGRVVVVPYETSRTPGQFMELLAAEGVTVLNQTPSAFYQLMAADEEKRPLNLSLRYVIFGGEALDIPRLKGWFDRHGDESPELINMYGITETTVHVTHRRIRVSDVERGAGSVIGRPLPDLKAQVLDESRELVPIGVAGELYVGGAGVARGYLRREELTASRFVNDPRGSGRMYRTGDLVRWLGTGELEYLGRIDTQVKIRGFRIELGEIEHVLLADGGLREVAVIARPGPSDQPRLLAYGVPEAGKPVTPNRLRQVCEEQLPDYMVPSAYVLLDALPLTANGKLDRDALPDPGAEALPQRPYVAPRNDVEAQLCVLWEEVLGVPAVGVQQNFFELGGHSLHAVQLMARVRERFAVDLPLRSLFQEPTVENLAAIIATQRSSGKDQDSARVRTAPTKGKRRQVRLTEQGELVESVSDLPPGG